MATLLFDPRVRLAMEARLRDMRPDSPRQWGRMTPHQAICHLSDGFRFVLGDRTATSAPLFLGPIVKAIAFRLPLPWPRGVQTMPEVDQEIGGTPPQEFEQDRATLLALIERFVARGGEERWPDHPMFGRMRRDDWGRWGYRHLDHHLRQFGH